MHGVDPPQKKSSKARNEHIALDEYKSNGTGQTMTCLRTITVGTKREVADFLHAMMVGFDFSPLVPDEGHDPFSSEEDS